MSIADFDNAPIEWKWSGTRVVVMRGVPGSGKSTTASKYASKALEHNVMFEGRAIVVSADKFFCDPETLGDYNWDGKHIKCAHQMCKHQFMQALRDKTWLIIVDNTNTQRWEYRFYCDQAEKFGAELQVLEMTCGSHPALALAKFHLRQKHGVPLEKIIEMEGRWEDDNRAIKIRPWFE
tara:strand:- start:855 stop:1391 length:537 start_codon:yes stop_codon:yes gene_type:complete